MDLFWLFVFGSCFGSFANVVIYRYPIIMGLTDRKKNLSFLSFPRSFCTSCKQPLKWFHNIPIISFLILKGRCAYCQEKFSTQYLLNELFIGISFVVSFTIFKQINLGFILLTLFFIFSVVLFWIDLKFYILPDFFNKGLILLGLIFHLLLNKEFIYSSVIGSFVGYFSLWVIFFIHKKITKKDGMGFGDFKLMSAQGAWFGWQALPYIFLGSSLIGLILFFIMAKSKGLTKQDPIPFGPAIILSGFIYLFLTWL